MSIVSSDLLTSLNGKSKSNLFGNTASLNDNSPEAIQNRFLKLLTVQMQNQDPNNPMDNSQLTSQLAQLSTVSGISQLNTTLAALMKGMESSQSLQSANMIGRSVLAPGKTMNLTTDTRMDQDGSNATSQKAVFGVQLEKPVDSLKITIRSADGKAVRSMDLGRQDAGVAPLIWDGITDSGAKAADGQYTFEVAASSGGTAVKATALAFGTVNSISTGADGVRLNVPNLGTIKTTDVVQII